MIPSNAPDYKGMLNVFLLTSFLKTVWDPRFSARERQDAATHLEMEIDRLNNASPANDGRLAVVIDQLTSLANETDIVPALSWYTDFLSGRDEDWLKAVSSDGIRRVCKSISHPPLRAKLVNTLLTLDLINDPRRPENSAVVRLFAESEGLLESGELIDDCKSIARILIQRAAAAPESTVQELVISNVRSFSLRVLHFCIKSKFPDDQGIPTAVVASILAEIGELGDRKPEFERLLLLSPKR